MDEFALWKLFPCSSEPDAAGLFFPNLNIFDFWMFTFRCEEL